MTKPQHGLVLAGAVRRGEFELEADLAVEPGEVVALLGPNGAGKSTLLRVVAGLLALDSGSLSLDGAVVDAVAQDCYVEPQGRRVGVVFQDHRLFPHLTVLHNVAFGVRSYGAGKKAARAVARAWLDQLGLADLERRYPKQLSGGQSQRVALARALACDPVALLLDEPLAALDVQTRAEVQGQLRTHLASFAGPVLMVTHDPVEALLLADRIVVLENGRVAQDGTKADVTSRPLTSYVARVVGVNLYRGVAANHRVTLAGGGSIHTADALDGDVLVALRPSAITLHGREPQPSSARNVWRARIASLAPLGDRVRVTTTGEQQAFIDVTASAVAELDLAPGQETWLSFKATEATVYPAQRS